MGTMCRHGTIIVKRLCAPDAKDSFALASHALCMAGTGRRIYIREWREFRGMTQDELGAAIGMTHGNISRIENGKRPYTRYQLEAIATELGTTPADLLSRDPNDPDDDASLWAQIPENQKARARAVIKALIDPPE